MIKIYTNPNSYAPMDGVRRHPDQYYELLGDLIIAGILIKLRGKLPHGGLFLSYLILFSILRFFVFFVRGSVGPVALGPEERTMDGVGHIDRDSTVADRDAGAKRKAERKPNWPLIN